jgi:hypothetical protein
MKISNSLIERLNERYGWTGLPDNAWGSVENFVAWLEVAGHDDLPVIAVNETKGRYYLSHLIGKSLRAEIDYLSLPISDFFNIIGFGGLVEKEIAEISGMPFNYATDGLSHAYIDSVCTSNLDIAFDLYCGKLVLVINARLALQSLGPRIKPEFEGLISHLFNNGPKAENLKALQQSMHPEAEMADGGWERMGLDGPISGLSNQFKDRYGSHEDAAQQAAVKLLEIINSESLAHPENLFDVGLQGNIVGFLSQATKRDLIDEVRRPRKEVEYDYLAGPELADPSSDLYGFTQLGIENYGATNSPDLDLLLEHLTPKERLIVDEVLVGFEEGYSFDSKKGFSFRQLWGDEYEKKSRRWRRVREKINQ